MISAPEFEEQKVLFVFPQEGDRLSYRNDNVVVKNHEGKIKHQSSCYTLFILCVVGNTSITTGLLQRSRKFGFSIILMTPSLKVYQIISAHAEGNTILRKKQYGYNSLELGRILIHNKIMNQRGALVSIRTKTTMQKEAIDTLEKHGDSILTLEPSITGFMGVEGSAARTYFAQIFNDVGWKTRQPRIKADYLNSALDIGYTILFNYVEAILGAFGFDLYYGVLHRCFYMRKSLVCDLIEPLRPIIDLQLRKSVHLKQFVKEDFEVFNNRYTLKWENNPKYVSAYLQAIMKYKNEIFTYLQQYYRAFMKEKDPEEFPVFILKGDA